MVSWLVTCTPGQQRGPSLGGKIGGSWEVFGLRIRVFSVLRQLVH